MRKFPKVLLASGILSLELLPLNIGSHFTSAAVNYVPCYADVSPASQNGPSASWDLNWGGGNGSYQYYFAYGDGSEVYQPTKSTVTYTAEDTSHHYTKSGTFYPNLHVTSINSADASATVKN